MDTEYYRKWYGFALVSTTLPTVVAVFYLSEVLFGGLPDVLGYLLVGYLFVVTIQSIACLTWYYNDARALEGTEADWTPFAALWTAGHVFLTPFLTAPLYLFVRTRNTGYPPRVRRLLENRRNDSA